MEEKVVFEGLSQYRGPFVYELAGSSFYLVMDNGMEGLLTFHTGEVLSWAPLGKSATYERYECLKADEDTYFVNVEVFDAKPRTGVTVILDVEQSLTTVVVAHTDTNPRFPGLVTNEFIFGAIKVPGKPLPKKRHGFTSDLVGLRACWQYNPEFSVTHVYYNANYIRATLGRSTEILAGSGGEFPYEEPCYYVKLKERLYIVSFLESNMTFRGLIGDNVLVVVDTARMHDVGRSFGLNQQHLPENYMLSAIGCWMESDGSIESQPSKYLV